MHVADSFEAMTAARPYRMTPLTQEQALDELRKFSGIQFDPRVVAAFDRLVEQKAGVGSSRTSRSTWSRNTSLRSAEPESRAVPRIGRQARRDGAKPYGLAARVSP